MSDKEDLIEILEPEDILIRKADNGVILYCINPDMTKDEGPEALDVDIFEIEDDSTGELLKGPLTKLLNAALKGMGIGPDESRVEISIKLKDRRKK